MLYARMAITLIKYIKYAWNAQRTAESALWMEYAHLVIQDFIVRITGVMQIAISINIWIKISALTAMVFVRDAMEANRIIA